MPIGRAEVTDGDGGWAPGPSLAAAPRVALARAGVHFARVALARAGVHFVRSPHLRRAPGHGILASARVPAPAGIRH
ncbi:MAG: hypothetical protein EA398_06280 [Deltaproteobacteria bacterium]|nr:MAG: hypothetical protein EA398_06280 [Deltaproteobacteria bacterium]